MRVSQLSDPNQLLPSPEQTWVHAVDSRARLLEALDASSATTNKNKNNESNDDGVITAIETDVLMGYSSTSDTTETIPIMAHPPNTASDLSMAEFLDLISQNHANRGNETAPSGRIVTKVIKLDFKEMEPVEPTLKAIVDKGLRTSPQGAFFLNADILPGPGFRWEGAVTIPAATFLETCLKYIRQTRDPSNANTTRFAFSMGFKADYTDAHGYTAVDVQAMSDLIAHYQLLADESVADDTASSRVGVVLALNARQLVKSLDKFDSIMTQFPDLQILVWTGKGELAIPQASIQVIRDHFGGILDMADRIGFDCQVSFMRNSKKLMMG